ncbi:hypothetical protein ColTof4_07056 [Colletotrichum tofieldiae]|uniref:SRR1-like domain-containing protein n=1 Tax=Colletotrichum tofieldiae TaxID=708197 RepID=A0A161W765_9PEZI|nr:hypothetical protein CT0861_08827 [Colletotrichum tofieldiae]GKT64660.1 hypothetical protein ColTof3_11999 [Colletotrichum tofieldiae]GKT74633.1 hypothetical protein ColTof4_07056 [Colletotrichum tofieldiae]GKT91822.1 hypothetical protein Ct61P_09672 [Colletotrichum tofieldiae]
MENSENSENSAWRQERVELSRKLQERYDAGQPLFTKKQLTSLAEQITNKTWVVQITDMVGKTTWDPIEWDCFENEWVKRDPSHDLKANGKVDSETLVIDYRPIQRLVIPCPSNQPYELPRPSCSVNVERATMPTRMTSAQIGMAVGKIRAEFEKHKNAWEVSSQCKKLKDILLSISIPSVINKIVCFGLGDLFDDSNDENDKIGSSDGSSEIRSHVQHAAALTVARILGERIGREIRCYSQDPAYNQATIEFLKSHNIVVLHDPQGFVDIDESTLVFSVAPSVPVKQIVTELARPAIIIWDTMLPADKESREWELMKFPNGNETWISPWITDPDSARTRRMEEEEYTSYPFPEDPVALNEIQILVKKASNGKKDMAQRL